MIDISVMRIPPISLPNSPPSFSPFLFLLLFRLIPLLPFSLNPAYIPFSLSSSRSIASFFPSFANLINGKGSAPLLNIKKLRCRVLRKRSLAPGTLIRSWLIDFDAIIIARDGI